MLKSYLAACPEELVQKKGGRYYTGLLAGIILKKSAGAMNLSLALDIGVLADTKKE